MEESVERRIQKNRLEKFELKKKGFSK